MRIDRRELLGLLTVGVGIRVSGERAGIRRGRSFSGSRRHPSVFGLAHSRRPGVSRQRISSRTSATYRRASATLTYNQYRDIWFKPESAIWRNDPTRFRLDLFHPGFIYFEAVEVSIVENGRATEIPFSPDLFAYGDGVRRPGDIDGVGFPAFVGATRSMPPAPTRSSSYFSARAISGRSPATRSTAFRRAGSRSTPPNRKARNSRPSGSSGSRSRVRFRHRRHLRAA